LRKWWSSRRGFDAPIHLDGTPALPEDFGRLEAKIYGRLSATQVD
jgi:hypothetical protein